jgi:hypothetical protein
MPDYRPYRAFTKFEHLRQLGSPHRFIIAYEEKRAANLGIGECWRWTCTSDLSQSLNRR